MAVPAFRVLRFESVASTQDLLVARARAGEDVTGLCVRAREQTRGRGRHGSAWSSPPGGSYQSLGLGRVAPPWLTLALGVGVAEALNAAFDAGAAVKWPNDVYRGGGKLGGIIVEVVAGQAVAGVGVNVGEVAPPGAASLTGADPDEVSDVVLRGVGSGLELALAGGEAVAARFAALDLLRGREVVVALGSAREGDVVTGVGAGVDATGALLVAVPGGPTVRVASGHVVRFRAG